MSEVSRTPESPGTSTATKVVLSAVEAVDPVDKYDRMLRLAEVFDSSGAEMRRRSRLGAEVLGDPAVSESAELSRPSFEQAEDHIRSATLGRHGLLTRSVELDVDALVVRATVLTYRWIDELQDAACKTLGSIAGRAIGYLAPEVALGGAIVTAGLIETDALDRDGVATYLNELAENNPQLMDHIVSGGGGLLDALQMRSLLTAGVLCGESGRLASGGGLRAAGIDPFTCDPTAALRDIAGEVVETSPTVAPADTSDGTAPRSIEELMTTLGVTSRSITVQKLAPGRYIVYLPGPDGGNRRRLRLVGGDQSVYAGQIVRAIESAVDGDTGARVMLVGSGPGGVAAAEVAASASSDSFVVDQVVTAGAPSAQVPRIPEGTRVLSLEDRCDPVVLLGSLINAASANRLTVVFDGGGLRGDSAHVAGARAADLAEHQALRAEITHLRELGFLAG